MPETRFDKLMGVGVAASIPTQPIPAGSRYISTDGTPNEKYSDGAAWQAMPSSGGGGGSGLYTAYLCYQEQQTSGTAGGTFTGGAWQTRVLNTEVADTGNHGTLASNQITLDAGTYLVRASAPAFDVDYHQLRLQNITDTATLVTGLSSMVASGAIGVTHAPLVGRFTISSAKVIELQHRCATTAATHGLGHANSFGTEIYATVELWKE